MKVDVARSLAGTEAKSSSRLSLNGFSEPMLSDAMQTVLQQHTWSSDRLGKALEASRCLQYISALIDNGK